MKNQRMVGSVDHVIVVSLHGMCNTISDLWSILNNVAQILYTHAYKYMHTYLHNGILYNHD